MIDCIFFNAVFCLFAATCWATPGTIYLQPNTTQLFTELYQGHGLLNLPERTFFESALYLDQSASPATIPLQPSNQAIFDHADQVLTAFHDRIGELELYIDPSKPKPVFYTACGSKHLIVALVYAIAMSEPNKKFLFVEQAPFYSGHPNAVKDLFNYPNARFQPFHDPSEIKKQPDEVLVEFVTSPNNPDGKLRRPLTDAKIIIADFVFASTAFSKDYLNKNLEWIRKVRAEGKHLFSFNSASKQFGKTASRCGYLWYPIYDSYAALIFQKFFNFISFSTVAGSSSGLADFLNLIKALTELPDAGEGLRQDAYQSLVKRHQLVEKGLRTRYPGTTTISTAGSPTFFAKINDPRTLEKRAADILREDLNVSVNPGEPMGESNEFIRLNLSSYSELLVEFLNRLSEQKYTIDDVLALSIRKCPKITISHSQYIARPGDCLIEVDASKGPIEIILPSFIDYLSSSQIKVTKMDASSHPVTIAAEGLKASLGAQNEEAVFHWSQPNYQNGTWVKKSVIPR